MKQKEKNMLEEKSYEEFLNMTEVELIDIYDDFLERHNYPDMSAEELMHEDSVWDNTAHRNALEYFSDAWVDNENF